MNDDYTIQLRYDHTYDTEPLYVTRRGLKSFLERHLNQINPNHHPDAIMLSIDSKGVWEDAKVRIKKGHVVETYTTNQQFIPFAAENPYQR